MAVACCCLFFPVTVQSWSLQFSQLDFVIWLLWTRVQSWFQSAPVASQRWHCWWVLLTFCLSTHCCADIWNASATCCRPPTASGCFVCPWEWSKSHWNLPVQPLPSQVSKPSCSHTTSPKEPAWWQGMSARVSHPSLLMSDQFWWERQGNEQEWAFVFCYL